MYIDNSLQARTYARKAFDRINAEQIPPTPDNFTVWYIYYSDRSPKLNEAINDIEQESTGFTEETCNTLYKIIENDKESEALKQAGAAIGDMIAAVANMLQKAGINAESYAQNLEKFSVQLEDGSEIGRIKDIVQSLRQETDHMAERTQKLQVELSESSKLTAQLRRRVEEAEKEARTDQLTGVANRRFFEEAMQAQAEHAAETGRPFSLLLGDIDYFKKFNDTFGHHVGDQVLRLVAQNLVGSVKGRDLVCRFGGEEFAILLPDTSLQNAVSLARSLRETIKSQKLVNRVTQEKLGTITISLGAAEHLPNEPLDAFIARADAALYMAKQAGRDRVVGDPGK